MTTELMADLAKIRNDELYLGFPSVYKVQVLKPSDAASQRHYHWEFESGT